MATLITGATGYIGSVLTVRLAGGGETVHILCRTRPELKSFDDPKIRVYTGDITEPESILRAMENVTRVYHIAAYARVWAKDPSIFYKINVEGTRNVLEAAVQKGIQKVVYTSTAGVIGPSASKPMTESDPRITGYFNAYEETKAQSETLAREFAARGLQVVIVNPSRVYGPGLDSGSNPFTKIVELYMRGKWKVIPGSGEDIGSYCYIDDVVDGIIQAMEKGKSGERYILGGANVTFNEFIQSARQLSGQDYKLRHIPFPLLKILSYAMVGYAKISGKPPMITPDWVDKYKYNWALDSSKAIRELSYRIRPLEDGMTKTVEWLKETRLKVT